MPHPAVFRGTVSTRKRGARAPKAVLLSSQLNSLGKGSLGPQGLFSQMEKGTNGDHSQLCPALTGLHQHFQPANLDIQSKGFHLSNAYLSISQAAPWTHWIQAPASADTEVASPSKMAFMDKAGILQPTLLFLKICDHGCREMAQWL